MFDSSRIYIPPLERVHVLAQRTSKRGEMYSKSHRAGVVAWNDEGDKGNSEELRNLSQE